MIVLHGFKLLEVNITCRKAFISIESTFAREHYFLTIISCQVGLNYGIDTFFFWLKVYEV